MASHRQIVLDLSQDQISSPSRGGAARPRPFQGHSLNSTIHDGRPAVRRKFKHTPRLLSLTMLLLAIGPIGSAAAATTPFSFTGSEQTYKVPAGVTRLHVDAVGGQGGSSGGLGATASADLTVSPGQTLYVEVAGKGRDGKPVFPTGSDSGGGFNGGGDGSLSSSAGGAGGGGASDVRTVPCSSPCSGNGASLGSRLIVASGGGGGAGGGAGYTPTTFNGGFGSSGAGGGGGAAGRGAGSDPGTGGGGTMATNGTLGRGGRGEPALGPLPMLNEQAGSGGGGGYQGGGGGYGDVGGGGSSFVASSVGNNPRFAADSSGTGKVTISDVYPPPAVSPPPQSTPPPSVGAGPLSTNPVGAIPANSNFTLGKTTVARDGTITVSLTAPGPGDFSAVGTTSSKAISAAGLQSAKKCKKGFVRKGKKCVAGTATYGSASASALAAGPIKLTITPSASARRALKRGKRLTVALAVSFQRAGGTATTKNSSISVKLGKKKGKR